MDILLIFINPIILKLNIRQLNSKEVFNRKKKILLKIQDSFLKTKNDLFSFELIDKYFRNKNNSDSLQIISDKTCNDLDFDEFFMFIDRTTSKVGQQYYYNILRNIPKERVKFVVQEQIITELINNPDQRLGIQYQLNKLTGYNVYYITSLFQDEHIKPPKWFFIIRLLSFTSLLSLITISFIPQSAFILMGVFIINIGIHWWNKRNLYEYVDSIPQLLKLIEVAKELIKPDIFKTNEKDIKSSIKNIVTVKNRMAFFKLEAKFESDLEIAFWFMLEFVKILFLLEPLLLFGVLKCLDTKRKDIHNIFSFIGHIDSMISIISLRQSVPSFCIPEINTIDKSLIAQDIYHPLIPYCVPNSIKTNSKSILLTGSNMSGKTTFIRTIGLNALSALTINTCFAKHFKTPVFKIYSAIRISDDLINDKSYYFEEVSTIKNMLDNSRTNDSNLFLLDEIFKGTNTIERISAGKAVLSVLYRNNNLVLVSTHDIELAYLLSEEYDLYHFSEKIKSKMVDFDYKLKPGKFKNRNAIKILEINNYPISVIKEALVLAYQLDEINWTNRIRDNK